METFDEVIEHFGIKGMRWGSRKAASTSVASEDASRHAVNVGRVKTGGTKALSTKDLQDLVTRMNLEQQYARLKSPSKGSVVAKFVGDTLLSVGKEQMTKLAREQATKLIERSFKK